MPIKTKIAIVHDVLFEFGGAERVLLSLIKMFPQAEVYTFYFNKNNPLIHNFFKKYNIKSSLIQIFPWVDKLGRFFSLLKPLAWIYFRMIDISSYDLIISSSHSFNSKLVKKSNRANHVCYLYTPPRFLYKEFNELSFVKTFPFNVALYPLLKLLRDIDLYSAKNPDVIVVTSKTVQKRVTQYYKRAVVIIPPPIDLPLPKKPNSPTYYLIHSRLVAQKGVELAIKTCTSYSLNLMVIGDGFLKNYLEKISGSTIKFIGSVDDRDLPQIYSKAKALLYCSIDEDFGLAPIEAMSFGIPVIAYKSGGVEETVIQGKTGYLFSDYSPAGLRQAIKLLEKNGFSRSACLKQSQKYSEEKFHRKFISLVKKITK